MPEPPTAAASAPADLTRDCIAYDQANLQIRPLGTTDWQLTDGRQALELLASQADAEQALSLARQGNKVCFIGRGNSRPDRKQYITEAWAVTNPPLRPLAHPEDCISYNPANLQVVDLGADGWRLVDGDSWLKVADNRADAEELLALARRSTQQCFIGRDNTRADRIDYIVQYWK